MQSDMAAAAAAADGINCKSRLLTPSPDRAIRHSELSITRARPTRVKLLSNMLYIATDRITTVPTHACLFRQV